MGMMRVLCIVVLCMILELRVNILTTSVIYNVLWFIFNIIVHYNFKFVCACEYASVCRLNRQTIDSKMCAQDNRHIDCI